MIFAGPVLASAFATLSLAWHAAVAPPASACPTAEPCGDLVGHVRRAGERAPLPDVAVVVTAAPIGAPVGRLRAPPPEDPAWTVRVTTDREGRFVAPAVPRARVRVVVIADGYVREDRVVDARRQRPVALFLRARDDAQYRTVVRPRLEPEAETDVTAHRLGDEELRTIPGAQSDALRGAQALPGFARPPFGVGLLVLRGAPPTQSTVILGEHPVPRAFHALPLAAIVPSDAIETLEIVPSNYSARWGPGTAGLVRIDPSSGRRDGHHGHAEADLIAASATQEGPVGRGSYLVGGRNAHVARVLSVVERVDKTSSYPNTGFWDYQAVMGGPVARGLELRASIYGAGDRARQRTSPIRYYEDPPLLTFRGQMHRPALTLVGGTPRVRVLASAALLIASQRFTLPDVSDTLRRDVQPSWRFEVRSRVHRVATLTLGTDGRVVRRRGSLVTYDLRTDENGETTRVPMKAQAEGTDGALAVYGVVELRAGPLRIVPGVRMQAFTVDETTAAALDPRLALELSAFDRLRLRAAAGIYSQPRTVTLGGRTAFIEEALGSGASRVILPAALVESFEPQIPEEDAPVLGLRRALHLSGGPELDGPLDTTIGVTAFGRFQEAPPLTAPAPADFLGSTGRIPYALEETQVDAGAEILVRKRLTSKLYGWIAYTVMKSVVGVAGNEHRGDFDQRHNLSVVASYGLPHGFRIGARFRLASGTPYTPVAAIGDFPQNVDGDVRPGRLVFGPVNSARMPTFHQLDLRVDKQWVFHRSMLAIYVDVQNVYNRQNVDLYVYDWDFTNTIATLGLPILPNLGARLQW